MVQRCIPFTKEAHLAACLNDRQRIKYTTAVDRAFERREAFALARPYSAVVLACGTSFVYRDGILCYLSRKTIRIVNVHEAATEEDVIGLECMGRKLGQQVQILSHVKLLHYQDGILSFLYYSASSSGGYERGERERWLVVVDTRIGAAARVKLAIVIQRQKIWVRNNERYLYVGAHDGMSTHGHREWVLQGYNLDTGKPTPPLTLKNFWGSDIRESIVFEIYDGYLYAVSNRSSFELEEVDWTSFYNCQRFPVKQPVEGCVELKRIWRRQHREGPINDSWTDLGLHKDEQTGDLLIIEARKEWKDGVNAQKRTFYSERLDFSGRSPNERIMSEPRSPSGSPSRPYHVGSPPTTPQYPRDDPMARLVGKGDNPQYADPCPRTHRHYYPEYSGPEPAPDTFMLSRTRYRTFLPASSAFLDVVLDDFPLRAPGSPYPPRIPQQQIRLRIGSRIRASPLDPTNKLLLRQPFITATGDPLPESEERFVDRGIRLWPPANAPPELLQLLNPGLGRVGDVDAVEDERSLIYLATPTHPSKESGEPNIVLVNFDRGVRHPGLPLLTWDGMNTKSQTDVQTVTLQSTREKSSGSDDTQPGEQGRPEQVEAEAEAKGKGGKPWWTRERAMYLDIRKGYRFE